jgi:hypothetical protein
MGGTCGAHLRNGKYIQKFQSKIIKGGYHLRDLWMNEKIILK